MIDKGERREFGQDTGVTPSGGRSTQIKYLNKVQIHIIKYYSSKVLLFQFYSSESKTF